MIRKSVAVVAMGLVSLTACTGTPETRPVAQQQQESVVALKIAEIADLGPVVTDVNGFTLYRFDNDKPNESTCDGECAAAWPPATVTDENFTVEGVDKVGSFVRKDGSRQLTVDGMPQYRFAKDGKPADFAADNVPYRPAHHLRVSTRGLAPDDFVMIAGFPGQTKRTLTALEVTHDVEWTYPTYLAVPDGPRLTVRLHSLHAFTRWIHRPWCDGPADGEARPGRRPPVDRPQPQPAAGRRARRRRCDGRGLPRGPRASVRHRHHDAA